MKNTIVIIAVIAVIVIAAIVVSNKPKIAEAPINNTSGVVGGVDTDTNVATTSATGSTDSVIVPSPATSTKPVDVSVGNATKLLANKWAWKETKASTGVVTKPKTDKFVVTFKSDGSVGGSTDCNGFGGSYTLNGQAIKFGDFISTQMYCEGSQEMEFTKAMMGVGSYSFDASGNLILKELSGSGTITFTKK